ncbi:MAG: hypothetical protein M3Y91_07000 [Actinomycetota bacterium]|nr:hypothetical protein [Actinomycetota bacterium]
MRYAANRPVAACCERFPGRYLSPADGDLYLVEFTVEGPTLHLTHQGVLDALGLDDRINTGRVDLPGPDDDPLLDACQGLADAVHDGWDDTPPALVYRTRTVPSARSVAFSGTTRTEIVRARTLREARHLIAILVARHGFVVPSIWLGS